MILSNKSIETKKLLLQFIIREINHEKECKRLAEFVQLGKGNKSIHETLVDFFEDSVVHDFPISDGVDN
jgi:hypothetical protein